ncbi:MAG: DUF4328 domain-containing protein [Bacteroidales bacterium]|nr:DUF4328 domain-containing protein [Bacteroidales bacterium]
MKNITNNSKQAKLTMLLNLLVLVFFIISMVFLLNFDKKNKTMLTDKPTYEFYQDALRNAEQPLKQHTAELDYYKVKMDTLQANKPDAKNKKELKKWQEEEKRISGILEEKEAQLASTDSTIAVAKATFEPIEANYHQLENDMASSKKTYKVMIWLTILLLVAKIACFAWWNYKNSLNLHEVAPWMKKGMKPFWAYLGWIIPVYNLIKPFSFFNEIWDETTYVLNDKDIVKEDPNEDNEFFLGLWWGFLLIAVVLMTWFIHSTFFTQGAMFVKLSHVGVAVVAIVCWAAYLLLECYLIRKYNVLNQKMVENADKF